MKPRVSFVIPHFDRSRLLRDAVQSVLCSAGVDIEVVVVDDGSSNDEWESIQTLHGERVRILRRTDGPKGPSRCRNIGLAASRADLIVFLDSDDAVAPWCAEQRVAVADKDADGHCWIFPIMLFDKVPGDTLILWNSMEGSDDAMRFVQSDPPWHTSSPIWRKSALVDLGGFDEDLVYGDDADLHLRAVLGGKEIRKISDGVPDVFVRRSTEARITNSLSTELIASRRKRLSAGTRFLRTTRGWDRYLKAWGGQYFREGEFLLFNVRDPSSELKRLFETWQRDFPAGGNSQSIARAYLSTALALRDKAYVGLRIARRIAMLVLPREFFPVSGAFERAALSASQAGELRRRLEAPGT